MLSSRAAWTSTISRDRIAIPFKAVRAWSTSPPATSAMIRNGTADLTRMLLLWIGFFIACYRRVRSSARGTRKVRIAAVNE